MNFLAKLVLGFAFVAAIANGVEGLSGHARKVRQFSWH